MLKISTRLTLWYLSATAIIILCMAVAMYFIYDAQRRTAVDTDLEDYTNFLVSGLGGEQKDLGEVFDELLERKDKPSTKLKAHRFVLASNDSLIFERSALRNMDSILADLEDKRNHDDKPSFYTITQFGNEYRVYSKPINVGKKSFTLIVITSLDRIYESLAQLRYILALLIPISLVFAGLIGIYIARRAFLPVSNITKAAAEITSKSLDVRVPVSKSQDELALLANTLNDMIDRLDVTFKSQQRFIADASHDIRTPLTGIQVELELLLKGDTLAENVKAILDSCLKSIYRLNCLTDNLLILARADSHQLTLFKSHVRLDELLMECVHQLNAVAKSKNISFLINVDDSIDINADDSMLRRVFTNLLDNAIKYSPEDDVVKVTLELKENTASIEITNKGVPISGEILKKIFNRFERGDKSRSTSGFGLGLAIVKALTEAHKGTVVITSTEIEGTKAKISLPI